MTIKELDKKEYIKFSKELNIHPLQTFAWGELKKPVWKPIRLGIFHDSEIRSIASILTRRIPLIGKSFGYIPRGLFSVEVLKELVKYCRELRLAFLLIDPDVDLQLTTNSNQPKSDIFEDVGLIKSGRQEQPIRTVVMDLTKSEEELLADMRSKHRQYIRKSVKKGVEIIEGKDSDIKEFCKILMEIISERAYKMHTIDYYKKVWELFRGEESAEMFIAKVKDEVIGAYMLIFSKDGTYEMYGGCPNRGKKYYANYALKWHSIKYAKNLGKTYYDQWGAELTQPGLVQFKEGFGGKVVDYQSQFVYVYDKLAYYLYNVLRRINNLLRR